MNFNKWHEKYDIGIRAMDNQHKKWFSVMNDFCDDLESRQQNGKLKKSLKKAIEYTTFHFSEEEDFMTSIHYPYFFEHKAVHTYIKLRLEEFQEQLTNDNLNDALYVTQEMKTWLQVDILEDDKKCADYIHDRKKVDLDNKRQKDNE